MKEVKMNTVVESRFFHGLQLMNKKTEMDIKCDFQVLDDFKVLMGVKEMVQRSTNKLKKL